MSQRDVERRTYRIAAALAGSAVVALLAGCTLPSATSSSDVTSTTGAVPGRVEATPPALPAPLATVGDASTALAQLGTLRVTREDTGAHYDRDDWKYPIRQPGFGKNCNTREMVLIQQGRHASGGPVQRDPDSCAPYSGQGNTWTSAYDGITVTDPAKLQIDHVVALEEVARSGARHWTAAQRQAYANDPAGLIAVTAHSNRTKGSDDPAQWLPEQHRCQFVQLWTNIKARFGLTVDQSEHDAIASVLRSCGAKAGAR